MVHRIYRFIGLISAIGILKSIIDFTPYRGHEYAGVVSVMTVLIIYELFIRDDK